MEADLKNAPEWLKKFGSAAFPSYEDVRQRQTEDGGPKEDTTLKKWLGKFGRFVGEAPATGGLGGVKGVAALGGAAAGLQFSEENEMGPLGQLASGVVGSLIPGAATASIKGIGKAITSPKKTAAEAISKAFTSNEKLALQKSIIEDAQKAGVKLDIGSITDSKILKGVQSYLSQSRLSGPALDNLKQSILDDVRTQYKTLANQLGETRFQTTHEAGLATQFALKEARDLDLNKARELYSSARERGANFQVYPGKVVAIVKQLEESLTPGSVKSTEQKAVLDTIQKLKGDVMTQSGDIKSAGIGELINNKIALNDIIDYELQGGAKQLLKRAVKAIDETIQSHGKNDPLFAKKWNQANKQFAEHAKTFRSKNINSALKTQDPSQLMSKMGNAQGIKELKKALGKTEDGKRLFDQLARFKMEDLLTKHLEEGASGQAKFGTFANAITKGKNGEILRELLGPENFKKLDNLGKTAKVLASTTNKFLNTSQSGTFLADFGVAGKLFSDIAQAFHGNPWPLVTTGGIAGSARLLANLFANPEFLKLTENAVLAMKANDTTKLQGFIQAIGQMTKQAIRETPQLQESPNQNGP